MRIRLRDGELRLRYLIEDTDRYGVTRIYLRRKGHPKVRLKSDPHTPEFMTEYRAALDGAPQKASASNVVVPGSLRWLCVKYFRECPEYKSYSTKTRSLKKGQLEALYDTYGHIPIRQLRPKHIRKMIADKSDTPFAANNRLKALRKVFDWAVEMEFEGLETSPCYDVKRLKTPKGGHRSWVAKDIRQYLDKHPLDTKAGLALAIFYYTGVRKSDAVRLGRQMETEDGWLRWREAKGGEVKETEIPIEPEFREILDTHHSKDRLHYLVTAFGKPFTANGFGNWFRKRCNEAGLPHCSAHGLRKASATAAADEGASTHGLKAFFNWATLKEPELYTAQADRKRAAARTGKLISLKNVLRPKVSNT